MRRVQSAGCPRQRLTLAPLGLLRALLAALLLGHAALGSATHVPPGPELAAAIEARLAGATAGRLAVRGRTLAATPLLARLYQGREFQPLWTRPGQAQAMLAAVVSAQADGLTPSDYHHEALEQLLGLGEALAADPGAAADLELLLSDALARLAYHLRFGKVDPGQLDRRWNYSRAVDLEDPAEWLARSAEAEDLAGVLAALRPNGPTYRALKDALAEARRLAGTGGWPTDLAAGKSLHPGQEDERVEWLRRRLAVTGELQRAGAPETGALYDEALAQAVRSFQRRHGLEEDGVVGPRTRAALTVPVERRIAQIRLNLERLRWVFRDVEEEFLAVNIAAFQAAYLRQGQAIWTSKVIVGRPYRQTPVFKAALEYLVLNPSWTVPPTILAQDVLPQLRRDPGYLARRGLRVVDARGRAVDPAGIDWSSVGARGFPYLLRQDPGEDNALGRIKFMFPNPYLVYLHDTPARALFERAERTFSSGCIRIERPLELAEILLRDAEGWDRAAIERAIASGRTQTVPLPRRVTIMLLYLTAFPGPEGEVEFREDVYGRDPPLAAALDGPFVFSPPEGYRLP